MNTLRRTSIPKWYEMIREQCPICGHAGGCIIHEDGKAVACIRKESDRPFSKDSSCPSWLHWLDEKKVIIPKQNIGQEVGNKKSESSVLNYMYRMLIDSTYLDDRHFEHLTGSKRQLSDQQIFNREYRSFPKNARSTVNEIQELTGMKSFAGIPGFYQEKGAYKDFWTLAGRDGIMIPFRNIENQIEGFQIRVDNPPNDVVIDKKSPGLHAKVIEQPNVVQVSYEGEILFEREFKLKETELILYENTEVGSVTLVKGKRYFWFSSANKPNGTGSGQPSPVHVSIPSEELSNWKTGTIRKANTVWLGEGPLKQDIAVDIISKVYDKEELENIGTTMLGLPGAGSWRLAIPILKKMGAKKVILCFDMDAISNPYVSKHLQECSKALKAEGFTGDIALWDGEKDGVGIDDCLLNKKLPNFKRLF